MCTIFFNLKDPNKKSGTGKEELYCNAWLGTAFLEQVLCLRGIELIPLLILKTDGDLKEEGRSEFLCTGRQNHASGDPTHARLPWLTKVGKGPQEYLSSVSKRWALLREGRRQSTIAALFTNAAVRIYDDRASGRSCKYNDVVVFNVKTTGNEKTKYRNVHAKRCLSGQGFFGVFGSGQRLLPPIFPFGTQISVPP